MTTLAIILVVATIVGGLAALWFFYEVLPPVLRRIWGRLFNDGFPRDYDAQDKEWCNATRKRWKRLPFKDHYIAWGGPLGFVREGVPAAWSAEHREELRKTLEFDLKFALPFRVDEYKIKGFSQLYETDCRTWRREILDRDQFVMMLRVKNRPKKWFPWTLGPPRPESQ